MSTYTTILGLGSCLRCGDGTARCEQATDGRTRYRACSSCSWATISSDFAGSCSAPPHVKALAQRVLLEPMVGDAAQVLADWLEENGHRRAADRVTGRAEDPGWSPRAGLVLEASAILRRVPCEPMWIRVDNALVFEPLSCWEVPCEPDPRRHVERRRFNGVLVPGAEDYDAVVREVIEVHRVDKIDRYSFENLRLGATLLLPFWELWFAGTPRQTGLAR